MTEYTGQYPIRSSSEQMGQVTRLLEEEGGRFFMSFDEERGSWVVGIEWGKEAEDSDMVGAAAYGVDKVAAAAVEVCLREAGR